MILTRKATLPPAITLLPGVSYLTVDYTSIASLTTALQGVHTVLSFTQPLSDPDSVAQKNLIDAAIKAGVQRFAPSQWGRYIPPFFPLSPRPATPPDPR